MPAPAPLTFGTAYYPDHWPERDWSRDLCAIRETGLTHVRFGEFSWTWYEPRPGKFQFTAFDRFLDLADGLGLRVVLCTPTCNPPPWLYAKHPDARVLDQRDHPHRGHRHHCNYNHPGARALAARAVRKLAEQYRDHPALSGWQIDNELTAGESGSRQFVYDYHPLTLARYREWLREKFGTLDALNEAWFTNFWSMRYSDWNEIDPPRVGEFGAVNPGAWLDWTRFRDFNVADLGHWQRDLLRQVKQTFRIGTNIPEVSPVMSAWLGQDYWALSEGLDFVGTDLYVYRGDPVAEQRQLAYSCDVIRSAAEAAGAEFGVLETQAGPHVLPWRMTFVGGLWKPEFLKQSASTYAAHGAQHIYFFLWRGTPGGAEVGMNSLAQMDGSESERTRALPGIMRAAAQARSRLQHVPTIRVHYSQDTLRLAAQVDPDQRGDSAMWGWHALLSDLGYRVQYVRDAAEAQVLPFSWVLPARPRGPVVAGVGAAFFDEHARVHLQNPLGIRHTGFEEKTNLKLGKVQPLAGGSQYLNFDLGTMYQRAARPGKRRLLQWARRELNLP